MNITYLYFYRNTATGAFTQATSPCLCDGLVEITKGEYMRGTRAKKIELETALAERSELRELKRADLADRLGISVEDLRLLR